jgi:tyrosyl-tRNA synthetase
MEFLNPEDQLKVLARGAFEIITPHELLDKLASSKRSGVPLRVKAGFDPTAPDLHLGHCVLLKKLRDFQDLGHTVVLIIGDYTAMIGDPSGRTETRPPLTGKEVQENARTYERQVFKILRKDRTEVLFNSSWLGRMSAQELLELATLENVARMLEREDFNRRYRSGAPITIREFLYPLIQAYDSVVVRADVELGGSDQKFNILLGRDIQRHFGLVPQVALLMPILEGLDGTRKMSKSLGNYIAIEDAPDEIFGKIMSLPDEVMWKYFELLSSRTLEEIESMRSDWHPMEAKKALALEMTAWFWGDEAAQAAKRAFEERFSKREFPDEAREVVLPKGGRLTLLDLVMECSERLKGRSEGKRLIQQGGLTIGGKKYTDPFGFPPMEEVLEVKIGKREFVRVRFSD